MPGAWESHILQSLLCMGFRAQRSVHFARIQIGAVYC